MHNGIDGEMLFAKDMSGRFDNNVLLQRRGSLVEI